MKDLAKIRSKIIIRQPFFGILAMRMILQEDSNIPTACTDGETLFYNSQWLDALTEEEVFGVICHEIMHIALKHPFRIKQEYDLKLWNVACDYVVNALLKKMNIRLPQGHLYNIFYEDMSAEQIYQDLVKKTQQGYQLEGLNSSQDPGNCGAVASPKDACRGKIVEKEWEAALASSYSLDSCPDLLKKVLRDILYPKANWTLLLREFLEESIAENYLWSKPNKRHLYRDMYLPSVQKEKVVSIIIAIDVSGSIISHKEMLDKFLEETITILSLFTNPSIKVWFFSSQIEAEIEYQEGEPLEITCAIGGGTDFRPIFRKAEELEVPPKAILIFTDLDGAMPSQIPDYPVLWAVPKQLSLRDVSFGQIIEIE